MVELGRFREVFRPLADVHGLRVGGFKCFIVVSSAGWCGVAFNVAGGGDGNLVAAMGDARIIASRWLTRPSIVPSKALRLT